MAAAGYGRGQLRAGRTTPILLVQSSGRDGPQVSAQRGTILAAVGVFVAVGCAVLVLSTALFPDREAVAATAAFVPPSPAEIALDQEPDLAALYATLKDAFPEDYAILQRQTHALLAQDDIAGAAWTAFRITTALIEREAPGAIEHADSEKLGAFMLRSAELLHIIQNNSPGVCAKIALGSLNREGVRPLLADPAVLNAAARAQNATLVAIHDGQTRPKNYRSPTGDELEMLGRIVMRQGGPRGDAVVVHARDFSNLAPEKQCALVLKSFRAVLATPEPSRSRLIAQAAASATTKLRK